MCGIVGYLRPDRDWSEERFTTLLRSSCDSLRHRGPDDEGVWIDAEHGAGLGHRRLSIIDVSEQGHQPMSSHDGRYIIAYNGEVYNYPELRGKLAAEGAAPEWQGSSDTEVILAAIVAWGLDAAVSAFNGMFAFALWDRQERALTLVRDRMGKKPLYYGWIGETFGFASELRAFKRHPDFDRIIDRDALALLLQLSYIPAPRSIYRGIHKLPAGCLLTIDHANNRGKNFNPDPDGEGKRPRRYWSAYGAIQRGAESPLIISATEAVERLDTLLTDAVRRRMISDVPLGAFLSGGIDSTAVVGLMQSISDRPVKTYTIGYDEEEYNEAHHAQAVADRLGTDHTSLILSPGDVREALVALPQLADEPIGDVATVPTYLVAKLARKSVTVSLTGDGGDEVFAGRDRFAVARSFQRNPVRRICDSLPAPVVCRVASLFRRAGGDGGTPLRRRLLATSRALLCGGPEKLYQRKYSRWPDPSTVALGSRNVFATLFTPDKSPPVDDWVQRIIHFDLATRLPDQMLAKVDRVSMAVSLETRAPLLDYRVIEFAQAAPMAYKIREGTGRWLLRQVLFRYVPKEMMERPKKPFSMPISQWLRGPLRDWGEELLSEERLRREGYLDPTLIRQRWEEHQAGKRDWLGSLWNVINFQAWLDN